MRAAPSSPRDADSATVAPSVLPAIKEADMFLAANGVWIWTTLAIIIWVALAFWPARVAARKGHSFLGYFLFSVLFFPAALIVAYMVSDRTTGMV